MYHMDFVLLTPNYLVDSLSEADEANTVMASLIADNCQ